MKQKAKKMKDLRFVQLQHWANWVIRIVGISIFVFLLYYTMRYTQYMVPEQEFEYLREYKDSILINFLSILIFGAIFVGITKLEKVISDKAKKRIQHVVLAICMMFQGVGGYLWVFAADRCPKGDQQSVFHAAARFFAGNYHSLKRGAYCGLYPHQLGLASLEELVFWIFGKADYHILQMIYVLFSVGICVAVYLILSELTDKFTPIVLGTIAEGFCIIPILYTVWLYGEIPFILFSLLAAGMFLRYERQQKIRYLCWFLFYITLAMLVRKNTLIMIVAFALVVMVHALANGKVRLLTVVLLAFLIPTLVYEGIFLMYEKRSGIPHSEGLPLNDFVYIGLVETEGRYGWDYYPSTQVYYDNGMDTAKTQAAVNEMIAQRWGEMCEDPKYLGTFMKYKVLSQWNVPFFQAMYFNSVHEDVHMERVTAFLDTLSEEHFFKILWCLDRLQMILYFGMLLYFLFSVRGDRSVLQQLLAVTIIGGFFFSIMWEAKTRYILPYYFMMFPLAMCGYEESIVFLRNKFYNKGYK